MQTELENDPLCYVNKPVRARVANEFMRLTVRFGDADGGAGTFSEVTTPFATFHSVLDTLCDPEGSEALYNRSKSSSKAYFKVGEGCAIDARMFHGLCYEPGYDKVIGKALEWLNRMLPEL